MGPRSRQALAFTRHLQSPSFYLESLPPWNCEVGEAGLMGFRACLVVGVEHQELVELQTAGGVEWMLPHDAWSRSIDRSRVRCSVAIEKLRS